MPAAEPRFIAHAPTRDMEQFRHVAEQLARLKPFGRVTLVVSDLAAKASHEKPTARSPWHEYAINSPALHRLFPHPCIAPHVPAAFVDANRRMMLAKAALLAEMDMDAAYWGVEPHFLPASFWREHPHLRGPRVDHPRRANGEAYSPCVDHARWREMVSEMVAAMRRAVPNLGAYVFKTNDAGAGLCWSAALYPGVQGPAHCRDVSPGQRVAHYVQAVHDGAKAGGGDVPVYIGHCNFWNNEVYDIQRLLPANTVLAHFDADSLAVGSEIGSAAPVRGMVNPLATFTAMQRWHKRRPHTVFVDLRASYDRASESATTTEAVVDAIIHGIEQPAASLLARLGALRELAGRWAGPHGEEVFEALYELDQALALRRACVGRSFASPSTAVQLRHVTRPLLIRPEVVDGEAEARWVDHVFNTDADEARRDYIDVAGGRMSGPALEQGMPAGWHAALKRLLTVAGRLEAAKDAPQRAFLYELATGLRVYVSLLRSLANFYFGQLIRDRHAVRLAQPPRPAKHVEGGTDDLMRFNTLMEDELANTLELMELLETRGLGQLAHAAEPAGEDVFLVGPDVLAQLRTKVELMRQHWRDAEGFLQPPAK